MKIKGFISIPAFIEKYIYKNEPGLENITHDFCKFIMDLDYEEYVNDKGNLIYKFNTNENYSVKRFIEFYFDKSKLDTEYNCKYEDELKLTKSISNEIFVIEFKDKILKLYIDSFKNSILNMIEI